MSRNRRHNRSTYRVAKDGVVELMTPPFIGTSNANYSETLSPTEGPIKELTEEEAELERELILATIRFEAEVKERRLFMTALEYPRKIEGALITQADNRPVLVAQRERDPEYVPGYM